MEHIKLLIISVFDNILCVPCGKMERPPLQGIPSQSKKSFLVREGFKLIRLTLDPETPPQADAATELLPGTFSDGRGQLVNMPGLMCR